MVVTLTKLTLHSVYPLFKISTRMKECQIITGERPRRFAPTCSHIIFAVTPLGQFLKFG